MWTRWSRLLLGVLVAPSRALAQDAPAGEATEAPPPSAVVHTPPRLLAPVTPRYPEEALAEGLVGEVAVIVLVGVDGVVVEAHAAPDAPVVFVAPAEEAARQLRFTPATDDGVPVPARLRVQFRFAPPVEAPAPGPDDAEAAGDTVVVYGEASRKETETHAVGVVGAEELARSGGDDLAETIASVPGVATARGNADSTKPIIRGQVERRLLVLYDGVRHESQKWGLDHATEIDPFSAGRIDVIKGAAGVRYGPDAIGGVVVVAPPPLRTAPGVGARVDLVGVSNGTRGVAAARVDGAPAAVPGLGWRVEGNYARGAALSTPTYVLGNTGSASWNLGATVGLARRVVTLETGFHHFDLRSGVCYCVQSGSTEDFLSQLDLEQPVGASSWTSSFHVDRPYQAVTHELALARARVPLAGGGQVEATWAFQLNHREEYDQTRTSITTAQYDFLLRTHTLDALVEHGERALGALGGVRGGLGVSGSLQENVYRGLPLIPNFRAFSGGLFGWERLTRGPVAVEVGVRHDHLARAAWLTTAAFRRSVARGTLDAADCEEGDTAARCPAAYDATSASLGAVWHVLPERLDARLDLSSASRFPNADELYMNGSAPTYPVYALGDPSLGPETTWGASPTVGLRLPWVEAEASAYLNYIDDYVYFAPELGADGAPLVDVTVQGAFPRFGFRPLDALFYGVDGGLAFGPDAPVRLALTAAMVRGVDVADGGPLAMVPPDRARAELRGAREHLGPLVAPSLGVSLEAVARQTRVDPEAEIAPAPDAYALLGADLGVEVPLGARSLQVGIQGSNLLNTRYRDYTSLLRYYADEPGREVRLRLTFDL